ncbi:hypothetical protein, partial [Klebsiella pneumoniae]|uniref:hypothetical protein n=1 Tax=Klebsiella pneumoniae TaxID=573 RepID=UPI001967C4E7
AIAMFTPETSIGEFVNFITHNGKTSVTIELPIKEVQLAKKKYEKTLLLQILSLVLSSFKLST